MPKSENFLLLKSIERSESLRFRRAWKEAHGAVCASQRKIGFSFVYMSSLRFIFIAQVQHLRNANSREIDWNRELFRRLTRHKKERNLTSPSERANDSLFFWQMAKLCHYTVARRALMHGPMKPEIITLFPPIESILESLFMSSSSGTYGQPIYEL